MPGGGDLSDQLKQQLSSSEVQMKQMLAAGDLEISREEVATQVATERDVQNANEELANPMVASFRKSQKPLDEFKIRLKKAEEDRIERRIIPMKDAEEFADAFAKQNPELKKQIL